MVHWRVGALVHHRIIGEFSIEISYDRGRSSSATAPINHPIAVQDSAPKHSSTDAVDLRTELLGEIAGAQFDLQRAIAELARNGLSNAELNEQLQVLHRLQQQIGSATPATLMALRSEIAASVAASQNAALQAHASATGIKAVSLADAAADVRQQVSAVMQGMKDFDRYLHFASAEDEEDYRRREAERRAYIERQQGRDTAEGDLNAAGAALGQLADAKAHGAADSPAFQERWDRLEGSAQRLRAAVVRSGGSTKEFDDQVQGAAAAPDQPERAAGSKPTPPAASPASSSDDDLASAMAALKSAGVRTTDAQHVTHGLTAEASSPERSGRS